MNVTERVRPKGYSGKPGKVVKVDGKHIVVQWIMGSGWEHYAWYTKEDLEVVE